ncbi:hypothetical protein GW17_00008374 [Ensete ventricosum]|nr:hypothetical protein GW17_00008374 [Ensete ventricosum]
MASLEQPPPALAHVDAADASSSCPPPPHHRRIPSWRHSRKLRIEIDLHLPRCGLRPSKVLIHSFWISLAGLFLIRLATAVTTATEARVFSIAGAVAAFLPWLLLFLSSAAITVLLETGVCDLTWIFSGSGGGPPRGEPRLVSGQGDDDRDGDGIGRGEASYAIVSSTMGTDASTFSTNQREPCLVGIVAGEASYGIVSSTMGTDASTSSTTQREPRLVSGQCDGDRDDEGEGSGGGEPRYAIVSYTTGTEASSSSGTRRETLLVSGPGDEDRDDEGEGSGGGEASYGISSSTAGSEASTSSATPPAVLPESVESAPQV